MPPQLPRTAGRAKNHSREISAGFHYDGTNAHFANDKPNLLMKRRGAPVPLYCSVPLLNLQTNRQRCCSAAYAVAAA